MIYTCICLVFFKDLFIIYLFIYLFMAASGFSCGTRDLRWGVRDLLLQRAVFIVVLGLLSSYGVQAPGGVGSVVRGTQAL